MRTPRPYAGEFQSPTPRFFGVSDRHLDPPDDVESDDPDSGEWEDLMGDDNADHEPDGLAGLTFRLGADA
jgi:hypothetical protein